MKYSRRMAKRSYLVRIWLKRLSHQSVLHFLQKHLLANFDIYTDTGITGATLSNEVPLYRLFKPLYDALISMDGELWKQMPYSESSSVTLEQADEFYCRITQ